MVIEPIGEVRSKITKGMEENWGEVVSEIHLQEKWANGLKGIEQFSHIIVVFYMHKAPFERERDLLRRPRKREDMPEIGIFARRARQLTRR